MPAIRTSDGRLVDPFNLKPEDIRPRIITRALAQINRYTGHALYPYSVAQHTRNLAVYCEKNEPELVKAALVHDFSESWFNDLASPVKVKFKTYKKHEHKAAVFVAKQLGVTEEELEAVSVYDKRIYINERNILFPNIERKKGMGDERVGLDIDPGLFSEMSWSSAYNSLSALFKKHFGNEVYWK